MRADRRFVAFAHIIVVTLLADKLTVLAMNAFYLFVTYNAGGQPSWDQRSCDLTPEGGWYNGQNSGQV